MNVSLYSKAILSIVAAAFTALIAANTDNDVSAAELVNVCIAIVTAVGVFLVPNLEASIGRYAKAIVALIGAALVSLSSAITDGVTVSEGLQIALAALAAIGVVVVPNVITQPPGVNEIAAENRRDVAL